MTPPSVKVHACFMALWFRGDQTGLVTIDGAFLNSVQASSYPATIPLKLVLEVEVDDAAHHPFAIRVAAVNDGGVCAEVNGLLRIRDIDIGVRRVVQLDLPAVMPAPGSYEVTVAIDGEPLPRMPLTATLSE